MLYRMKIRLSCLSLVLVLASAPPSAVAEKTIYFLVGNLSAREFIEGGFDAYVLPLCKQEDIAHARYLISLGSKVFLTEGALPRWS